MARAIGIDLGTSRSVVATIDRGRPKVIPNAEGQLVTPSVVAFPLEGGVLVGQAARREGAVQPERTVASVKRYMGSGRRYAIGSKEFAPQELSAFILGKLKKDAEAYLGERVERAVISVPAYFNDRQRQATKEAATIAGLEVMRLINEPTAAALAYGLEREEVHTILVWDLGGGTFDVSILELGEGIFEVRAVSGDNWLGGDDFDRRVMEYLAGEHRRRTGSDFPENAVAWERLREAAEQAKIHLSLSSHTSVHIPVVEAELENRHLEIVLTRETLESLVADLLQRQVSPVRQVLADAGLTPREIDRVILVGNGTKMPAVRQLAKQLLGQEPYRYIDPDLVTALGAAIQAGVLLGLVEKITLVDVLPLSLGIETQGGLMARIIPRNTPLPASDSRLFTTAADYQSAMDIHVLQGERDLAVDNVSLGQFQLKDIPAAPRGIPKVEVAFQADVDGIIHISATELLSDSQVQVKLASTKLISPNEIDHLIREAHAKAEEDRSKTEQVVAGIEANNLVVAAESVLKHLASVAAGQQVEHLKEVISLLQEASARGASQDMRHRCSELRQLLAAIASEKAAGKWCDTVAAGQTDQGR